MRGNEFAEMNAFVAIADHGNFTRAATHLDVSTTTVLGPAWLPAMGDTAIRLVEA